MLEGHVHKGEVQVLEVSHKPYSPLVMVCVWRDVNDGRVVGQEVVVPCRGHF